MSNIKYTRARKASKWGTHGTTFNHIWSLIPAFLKTKLSGKELGQMIDEYHQKVFTLGKSTAINEALTEGTIYKVKGQQVDVYSLTFVKSA